MSADPSVPLSDVSRGLLDALVVAYRDHVLRRLGEEATPQIDEVLSQGKEWLASSLAELLALPFTEQRRGPLEIFQEAIRFPTDHLAAAGRRPASRDPVAISALPGDVYDLAPASTRDLGEDVWATHLAWGAVKAAAITRPPQPEPTDGDL